MRYLEDLRDRAGSMRRLGIAPLLFRFVVWLTGFAALLYALPLQLQLPAVWAVLLVLALVPAVKADSWLVLSLELLAVFGWLVRTALLEEPVSFVAVLWLASALYVHHVSASYAAALPLSAVVTRGVWLRPLVRVIAVLAATGVLAAAGSWLTGWVSVNSSVAIPVVGVVVALGLAVMLAVRARSSRT